MATRVTNADVTQVDPDLGENAADVAETKQAPSSHGNFMAAGSPGTTIREKM